MIYFLIALSIFLVFCILQNSLQLGAFKTIAKTAIRTYRPKRSQETARIIVLGILGLAALASIPVLLILNTTAYTGEQCLTLVSLALFCFLYAFAPYSASYWCLTADGLYTYRFRKLIPWSEIIAAGVMRRKHKTFLTLQVKKGSGDTFKQAFYAFPIESTAADEAKSIISDFLHALEKERMLKHNAAEKAIPLKERKWY